MNHPEVLEAVRNARYQLRLAIEAAPKKSNLSDDLEGVAETLDEIGNTLRDGEIDAAGMYT